MEREWQPWTRQPHSVAGKVVVAILTEALMRRLEIQN